MGRAIKAAGYDEWAGQRTPTNPASTAASGDRWASVPAASRHRSRSRRGTELDLGSVAKGWLADRIARTVHRSGHEVCANMGGDIRVIAAQPWTVVGPGHPRRHRCPRGPGGRRDGHQWHRSPRMDRRASHHRSAHRLSGADSVVERHGRCGHCGRRERCRDRRCDPGRPGPRVDDAAGYRCSLRLPRPDVDHRPLEAGGGMTWELIRITGLVSLALLTVSVALGIAGPAIRRPTGRLTSVSVHLTAAVGEPYWSSRTSCSPSWTVGSPCRCPRRSCPEPRSGTAVDRRRNGRIRPHARHRRHLRTPAAGTAVVVACASGGLHRRGCSYGCTH